MKKLIIPITSLFIGLFILTSCGTNGGNSATSTPPTLSTPGSTGNGMGGISVGNGQVYISSLGYGFKYSNSLKLNEVSAREVILDNSGMKPEKISNLKIEVLQSPLEKKLEIQTDEDLKRFAEQQLPNEKVEKVTIAGSPAYRTKRVQSDGLHSISYILGANKVVLSIELIAFIAGMGQVLLEPVPETLQFDVEAPQLLEVKQGSVNWKAGEEVSLLLRISGLRDNEDSRVKVSLKREDVDDKTDALWEFAYQKPKKIKDDQYEIRWKTNEFLPHGTYDLKHIFVMDAARNMAHYKIREDGTESHYEIYRQLAEPTGKENEFLPVDKIPEGNLTNFEMLKINIANDGREDLKSPTLLNVQTDKKEYQVGEALEVIFQTEDDVAGIDPTQAQVEILSVEPFDAGHFEDFNPEKIEMIDAKTFRATFHIGKYFPAGKFAVKEIAVSDKSGKTSYYNTQPWNQQSDRKPFEEMQFSSLEVAMVVKNDYFWFSDALLYRSIIDGPLTPTFTIKNDGIVDRDPPKIEKFITTPKVLIRGETSIFELELNKEEISTLTRYGFFLELSREDTSGSQVSNEFITAPVVGECYPLEGNRVRINLEVPTTLEVGKYSARMIIIRDQAGNEAAYFANLRGDRDSVENGEGRFAIKKANDPTYVLEVERKEERSRPDQANLGHTRSISTLPVLTFEVKSK